jgi:hypothetical protein
LAQLSGGTSAEMRENNVVQLRRNWSPLKLGNKGIEVLKAGRLAAFFFFLRRMLTAMLCSVYNPAR